VHLTVSHAKREWGKPSQVGQSLAFAIRQKFPQKFPRPRPTLPTLPLLFCKYEMHPPTFPLVALIENLGKFRKITLLDFQHQEPKLKINTENK